MGAVRARADLTRLTARRALVLGADLHVTVAVLVDRDVRDPCRVTVVGVDADQAGARGGRPDVLQLDVAGVLRGAVAAGTDQLAEVVDLEVLHDQGADAVVLEHLVLGQLRATAVDCAGRRGGAAAEGRGVLAHVLPPDVLDGADARAVHTVGGRSAEDDVLQGGAVRQLDYRGLVLVLVATAQIAAAVQALHATVVRARDLDGR